MKSRGPWDSLRGTAGVFHPVLSRTEAGDTQCGLPVGTEARTLAFQDPLRFFSQPQEFDEALRVALGVCWGSRPIFLLERMGSSR